MPFETLCIITLAEQTDSARQYFNIIADALEHELAELSKIGKWFSPPKINIDRDKFEITFGYRISLTLAFFKRVFSNKFAKAHKINEQYIWQHNDVIYYGSLADYQKYSLLCRQCKYLLFDYTDEAKAKYLNKTDDYSKKCLKIKEKLDGSQSRFSFFSPLPQNSVEFIQRIFEENDAIYFGEYDHHKSLPHTFIVEHAKALKDYGVSIFFTEYFIFKDHQPLLDYYFNSSEDEIPIELAKCIESIHDRLGYHVYSLFDLLKILKEQKIRIIGIENSSRLIYIELTKFDQGKDRDPTAVKSFDYYAQKIIKANTKPGDKFIVSTGLAHTGTTQDIGLLQLVERKSVSIVPHLTDRVSSYEKFFKLHSPGNQDLTVKARAKYSHNVHGQNNDYDFALIY